MDKFLEISLLGRIDIKRANPSLPSLATRKAQALFIYLACIGQPQPRDVLAELLWPDRPQAQARHNLRTDLARLRQALSPYISSAQQQLAFNRAEPHWLDVAELEQQLAIVRQAAPLSEAQACALAGALNLYQGDFLAGFHLPDAPDFDLWATIERERLHRLAIEGLHRLAGYHLSLGDYPAGIAWSRRLLALDRFDEVAQSQMLRLLCLNGQRQAALSHYDHYLQTLATEIGIGPGVEIRALCEQIKTGDLSRGACRLLSSHPEPVEGLSKEEQRRKGAISSPLPRHNLPAFTASFIGRKTDLAQLQAYFTQSDCRLITVAGLGGQGKTWLALQAAWAALSLFPDRVYFVPLVEVAGLDDTSEVGIEALRQRLILAIAEALGLELTGRISPLLELNRYLHDKQLLLVLDNFEHLLAAAGLVSDLLQAAPRLKVLVTSREKLRLLGEWTLLLKGLDYPPAPRRQPDWGRSEPPPPEAEWRTQAGMQKLAEFSAVQLLIQRARQARPDFSLTPTNSPTIARLCQLVEGSPLGVELAAAQLGAFSSAEVVTAVESNLGRLSAELQNLSPRHRSLQAMFEDSWRRLTLAEQHALAQLSVFRGGFNAATAKTVAGVDWEHLLTLVNKSLVRFGQARRYELPELLRQFAAEKLAGLPHNLSEVTRDRHCAYYLRLMAQRASDLEDRRRHQALSELRPEMDNLRQAWQWALTQTHVALLQNSLTALQQFYLCLGFIREEEMIFRLAVERVEAQPIESLVQPVLMDQ